MGALALDAGGGDVGELFEFLGDVAAAVRWWGPGPVAVEAVVITVWQLPGAVIVGASAWWLHGRRSR